MALLRKCSRCGEEKPLSEYNKKSRGRLQPLCKTCNSAYLKRHYEENREYYLAKSRYYKILGKRQRFAWLIEYFETHPCSDCGESDPVVLTFDHVRGVKSNTVANLLGQGFSLNMIQSEIEKCEVVCANCHWRRTAKQFKWYAFMDLELPDGPPSLLKRRRNR